MLLVNPVFSVSTKACLFASAAIQAPERMPDYDVQKHKGHLIYAAATPAEGNKRWYAEGIVFSTNSPEPVEKIHRMKSKLDFRTEKQARDHAIALCKIWIDLQRGKKKPPPS